MNTNTHPAGSAGLRKMAVIGPSAFLNSLATGSVNLGLIFLAREVFLAPPSVVGRMGALWSSAYFASCLAFRGLTSCLVPRHSMAFMSLSAAGILLAFCSFPSMTSAFLAYGAFGTVIAFFWPPLMGWLSRGLEGKDLSRATGLFSFSWSFGGIVSPYIAGTLSERGKFLPLWFALGVFVLNAAFLLASKRFLADADERPSPDRSSVGPLPDQSTPLRFPAWASVFVVYAAVGAMANIFPLFARGDLGLSESRTGLMVTVRMAATTSGFLFLGRFAFWRFRRAFLALPPILALGALVVLALASATPAFLVLGLIAVGFAAAWAYNNSMFYGASGAPDRDRRMTTHEALLTAGQVLGSLAGGILYQAVSMRLVFLCLAGLSAAGVWAQAVMVRRRFGEAPAIRPPLGEEPRP